MNKVNKPQDASTDKAPVTTDAQAAAPAAGGHKRIPGVHYHIGSEEDPHKEHNRASIAAGHGGTYEIIDGKRTLVEPCTADHPDGNCARDKDGKPIVFEAPVPHHERKAKE